MVRFACSLAIVAAFALSVAANSPPPPPEAGFKRVPYENVLKLAARIPGYKFFTFQGLVGREKTIEEELQLGTERGIAVPSSTWPWATAGIVAVPDKVMEEVKTKENLAAMLFRESVDGLPAGVVVYETHGTSQDLKASDPRTKVENVITVALDDKAGVKFTVQETPAPAGNVAAAEPSSRPQLAMVIGGIAAALAIVTLGLWYFRR